MGEMAADLGDAHPNTDTLPNLNTHSDRHPFSDGPADFFLKHGGWSLKHHRNAGHYTNRNPNYWSETVIDRRSTLNLLLPARRGTRRSTKR